MSNNVEFPSRPDMGSQELTEEIIRLRAYQLFEKRGGEHGHDVEDWIQAEAEVMGKKPTELSARAERTARAAAA